MKRTDVLEHRIRELKSGEGVTLLFPEGEWKLEYIEECCDCGAQHKVNVIIDMAARTMKITWYVWRKSNIKERWSAARQRRLIRNCGNRILSARVYRI